MHPPAVQIFRLWQTFLVNVNPLVKIFHAPTVQQTILDASGELEKVSRPTEALMFAIYFLAVTSMSDTDCQSILKEPRQALLSKYCHATQQALINSKFLKSLNISTLQALTLYTVSSMFFSFTAESRTTRQFWCELALSCFMRLAWRSTDPTSISENLRIISHSSARSLGQGLIP